MQREKNAAIPKLMKISMIDDMVIEITDEGIVFCEGLTCDPVGLYENRRQCGNCPLLKFAERYSAIKSEE